MPDYSSAGLMLQMQQEADLKTALRCSRAVNVLVILVVALALVPGLGLILGVGMMGLMMVVATALSIVTIVKGRLMRGLLDLVAVWLVVPAVVIVLQFAGLTWLAQYGKQIQEEAREKVRIDRARAAQAAPQVQPQAVSPPVVPQDPRLWALREKVVRYYTAQGMQVEDSVKARSVTVMVSMIQGDSLRYAELQKLAEAGLAIWTAEDGGMLNLLIKDTSGKYLVSGDPISGAKVLR